MKFEKRAVLNFFGISYEPFFNVILKADWMNTQIISCSLLCGFSMQKL